MGTGSSEVSVRGRDGGRKGGRKGGREGEREGRRKGERKEGAKQLKIASFPFCLVPLTNSVAAVAILPYSSYDDTDLTVAMAIQLLW